MSLISSTLDNSKENQLPLFYLGKSSSVKIILIVFVCFRHLLWKHARGESKRVVFVSAPVPIAPFGAQTCLFHIRPRDAITESGFCRCESHRDRVWRDFRMCANLFNCAVVEPALISRVGLALPWEFGRDRVRCCGAPILSV